MKSKAELLMEVFAAAHGNAEMMRTLAETQKAMTELAVRYLAETGLDPRSGSTLMPMMTGLSQLRSGTQDLVIDGDVPKKRGRKPKQLLLTAGTPVDEPQAPKKRGRPPLPVTENGKPAISAARLKSIRKAKAAYIALLRKYRAAGGTQSTPKKDIMVAFLESTGANTRATA